jgi:hypothetical protein
MEEGKRAPEIKVRRKRMWEAEVKLIDAELPHPVDS